MAGSRFLSSQGTKVGASLAALIASSLVLVATPVGAALSHSGWSDVGPPSAPSGFPNSGLSSVSCPSKTLCFAVGNYVSSSSQSAIMAAKQLNGNWFQAVDIALPKDSHSSPLAQLKSIACTSTSNCWAVGFYVDAGSVQQSMATHFNGSTWSRAKQIASPVNSGGISTLNSIACPSPTSCVAVGSYLRTGFGRAAQTTTLVNGRWSTETETGLPDDASSFSPSEFTSVSCLSSTICWTVGTYRNGRPAIAPMAARWKAGTIKNAQATPYPNDANLTTVPASLSSISCSASVGCIAGGTYMDGTSTHQGFTIAMRGTTWSATARKLLVPIDAASDPNVITVQVACAANLQCLVSHRYYTSGSSRVALTDYAPGVWGAPAGFDSKASWGSEVDGMACHTSSTCIAVGTAAQVPYTSKATSTIITR